MDAQYAWQQGEEQQNDNMQLSDARTLSIALLVGGIGFQLCLWYQIMRDPTAGDSTDRGLLRVLVQSMENRPPTYHHPMLEERCAINLYGLPRAFKSLVLPSLIKNVIRRK